MKLYKAIGRYTASAAPVTMIINIDNIDCFCSSNDFPGYDYVHINGHNIGLIRHEDTEKIEKLLVANIISNE